MFGGDVVKKENQLSPARQADGRFAPGVSGNPSGPPVGYKKKLARVCEQLVEAFDDEIGPEGLRQLARENPEFFLKILVAIMPKDADAFVTRMYTIMPTITQDGVPIEYNIGERCNRDK
jgi:hypothetical protein